MGSRALVVTSVFDKSGAAPQLGLEAYSYYHVYRSFLPLLQRLGSVIEVSRPESRLDFALQRARERGLAAAHLSFLPLQHMYLSSLAANVAFPFWEFPDIPSDDFDHNPRNNWARIADRLSLIVCASDFTRAAFVRAGVRTPVEVVRVPVAAAHRDVPPWRPGTAGQLDCAAYVFPSGDRVQPAPPPVRLPVYLRARARRFYDHQLLPRLPSPIARGISAGAEVAHAYLGALAARRPLPRPAVATLQLSGVVYTSFVSPFDPRKNWEDLLTAFLLALRDEADAMLVLKLVVAPHLVEAGVRTVVDYYRDRGLAHRCKLAVVAASLSEPQMLALERLSTYAISATRAEGASLPLQAYLAAGRPVVAPCHSALAEYVDAQVAFIVASHPEPTHWPHDPAQRLKTTWHRIVWQSLHDQIRASYDFAKTGGDDYTRMARRARERMYELAGDDRVWPQLRAALEPVSDHPPG